ncbi:ORC ubiquitin ligase 1-like [Lineus longissimus]|uniref:ORC ubiquitin ligase 1-like n=1 Tax=Lineus longissimus TaxID=88925 RepID=UPI00315CE679
MDVWLQRNQQCPACRTPISEETPLQKVLGGLNQGDESMCDSFSNPELRRARLELLVRDYEDEIERMQGHIVGVEGENKMLKDRLQRLSPDSDSGSEKEGKDRCARGSSPDMNVLLVMTKKLQDANALYEKAKKDSARYKEKNRNLTDENINLVRENQRLRIEIANRSPMKYGRFTVSAMQSKMDAYEKQVIQLQKALEKSDTYVEEVEKELEAFRKDGTAVYATSVHTKMDTKSEADKRAETCRKSLFGGSKLHKGAENENKMAENYREDDKLSSNLKVPPSGLVQLAAWRLEHGDDASEKSPKFSTFKPDDLDSRRTSTFITGRSSLGGRTDMKHAKADGSFDADLPSPIVGTPSLPLSRLKIKNDSDDGPSPKRRSQPVAAEGRSEATTGGKDYEMPEVCRNDDDKDEDSSDLPSGIPGLSDSNDKIYERSCSRSSSGSSGPPTPTRRFPTMGISASYAIGHSPGVPVAKEVPVTVASAFVGYSLYSMDEARSSPPAQEPLTSGSLDNAVLFNQGTGIYGTHRHRTHSNGSTGLNSYNATASLALAKSTSVLPQPDSTTDLSASKPETENANSNGSTTELDCSITPEFSDCLKILNEAEKKVGRRKLEGVDSVDGDSNSEQFTVEKCEDSEPQYESLNFRSRSDSNDASSRSTDSHLSTDSLKSADFRSSDNTARIVHSKKFTGNPNLKAMCDNSEAGRRFSLGGKLGEMRQNLKHFLRRTPEKRKRSEGGIPCEDMVPFSPSKAMKLTHL